MDRAAVRTNGGRFDSVRSRSTQRLDSCCATGERCLSRPFDLPRHPSILESGWWGFPWRHARGPVAVDRS